MKQNLILIIVCLLPTMAIGQNNGIDVVKMEKEVMTYKKLFSHADSLTTLGNVGQISDGLIEIAKSLDKRKPVDYYLKAGEMFEMGKYNDASFLYYMGDLRYRYYNSVNPKYSKSGDGALHASF
ncbi:MAG: hypothetical protein ACKO96_40680, partial [Flammeovirgaceae bacterium]